MANEIPCCLITDNMAAMLMNTRHIDAIIVGADRIALNGDGANKIGTYGLAVLASYHHIPFYLAAPFSTFDTSIKSGGEIVIEERNPDEVRTYKESSWPQGCSCIQSGIRCDSQSSDNRDYH